MTHKDLVDIATKWAQGRHQIVIKERGAIGEIPDVMAFDYSYSTLIECKVSKSDFNRDKNKMSRRRPEYGMGNYRIYCVPNGLITRDDIPDTWVLLNVFPTGYAKLDTNIYKRREGAIWWHEDTLEGLRAEKHILYNHFLYPHEK